MSKIFLYPRPDKMIGSPNPYILNFITALSKTHVVVNENAKNKGVINLFKFFFSTEIFIFNWIENLPEKKFGKFQILLFIFFMVCTKIMKKKIIWILHNKYSHHKKDAGIDFMYQFMMRYSDKIITHSYSGLEFVRSRYPKYARKVQVIVHPVGEMFITERPSKKNYDFIIWGTIFPYKGIDKFLKFIKESPQAKDYKILLIGRCFNPTYRETLNSLLTENVTYYDHMYEINELAEFSQEAKFTLFTYKSNTVISSGSLIDAIRMGSIIIAPNHGGFKDLNHYSFLKTYDSFEEIFEIHKNFISDEEREKEEKAAFFKENNWDVFVNKLERIFEELNKH